MPTIEQVTSSINALTEDFNTITHNLSNVSTVGYKRICNSFVKALQAQLGQQGDPSGTINLETQLDFSQGNLVETGRSLDFAIYGKGFFVIETPEGPLYTRNGIFYTNQNGQITDSDGRIVAGQGGPVTLPSGIAPSQINVSADGSISAGGVVVGKFNIVNFKENENELVAVGGNCFKMPDENVTPVPADKMVVRQGYQESSNVKTVDELVDMIMVSRLYEANMKFIAAQRETSSSIIGVAMG
jgi:flagellar basal body rod protein FlgG